MNSYSYITLEEALAIHLKTVENSGGGLTQCIDSRKLESVLCHIQNDDYYPEFVDKLTHLFFCACQFHCFADGNKRIAITLSTQFLLKNGYRFHQRKGWHFVKTLRSSKRFRKGRHYPAGHAARRQVV